MALNPTLDSFLKCSQYLILAYASFEGLPQPANDALSAKDCLSFSGVPYSDSSLIVFAAELAKSNQERSDSY